VHRDRPVRKERRQCRRDLPSTSTAEADEDDVGHAFAGSGERGQSLACKSVRQHGQEVLDLGPSSQLRDRVLHQCRDLLPVELIPELGDQRLGHLLNVGLGGREDRGTHDWSVPR
jgi:hypothetical protein